MPKMSKLKKLELYGKEAREYIESMSDGYEQPIVVMDGFDAAIIGIIEVDRYPVAVYSYQLMIDVLVVRDKMSEDEASEYIYYNCYVPGEHYPVILHQGCLPISFRVDTNLLLNEVQEQPASPDSRQLALPL
jgi:hypothetical protein